jgi:hypothetical protein
VEFLRIFILVQTFDSTVGRVYGYHYLKQGVIELILLFWESAQRPRLPILCHKLKFGLHKFGKFRLFRKSSTLTHIGLFHL